MKIIKKALKVRLYPNKNQIQLINQTIGNCRWLWNHILNNVIEYKKEHSNYDGYKQLNPKDLKKEYNWLMIGSSRALQQTQRDLVQAFKNIKRNGNGFPKFKKKKNKNSYREPQVKNQIRIENNKIHLLKLGFVKFRCSKAYKKILNEISYLDIVNCTISKTSTGKYFASICVDINIKEKDLTGKIVGIDLGLNKFIYTSDDESTDNPKFYRKLENKLSFQQRKLSKKKLYSKNWYKQSLKVNKVHEKIKNCRLYFLHNISSQIVNENQIVFVEDLSVENMIKNKSLSKSISDVSWSEFIRQLEYKFDWYGGRLIKIGRFFPSSKLCSNCGSKKDDLKLSDRKFICSNCGLVIDRDYNASINILNEGLNKLNTDELSGINASGDDKLLSSMKEELILCHI